MVLGLCWAATAVLQAAAPESATLTATSVVRADPRTKRLVRTVAVSGRPAVPASSAKATGAKTAVPVRQNTPALAVVIEPAPTLSPASPDTSATGIDQYVRQAAGRYSLDPLMVHSVIQVESNYNPFAVSRKGAQGMMQLMPETARRLSVKDAFNPWENIDGGARYLKYLFDLFGDPRLVLAAYNAGENAVFKYGGVPPYRETADYVTKVSKKWNEAVQAAHASCASKPEAAAATPRISQYIDSEGRMHFETQSTP